MFERIGLLLLFAAVAGDRSEARETGDSNAGDTEPVRVRPVEDVDLRRYAGLWYEIAKIPNKFQDHCARGTTAEYTLRNDGRIDVVNRCIEEDGTEDSAKGIARVVDRRGNARLEVSFVSFLGWRPFWGDYWILGLDEDYRWALVGTPDRKYGWILSRTPQLPEASLAEILAIAEQNGYDADVFEASPPPTSSPGKTDTMNILDFSDGDRTEWYVVNDGVMGGVSQSAMRRTKDGTGVFSGELSLENSGGFASVRAALGKKDLSRFSGLEARVMGDGRTYQLRLRTDDRLDGIAYRAEFETRDAEWLVVRFPFDEFVPTFRGRIQPDTEALNTARIEQLAFLLADENPGPLSLEIDFVRAWSAE